MMTDDLTYTHSSGVEESKAEFLEGLKSGKYVYREITPRGRKVRVHGDAAIVSGPAHVVIEPGGKRTELDLYFTELYVKEGGPVADGAVAVDAPARARRGRPGDEVGRVQIFGETPGPAGSSQAEIARLVPLEVLACLMIAE